MSKQSYGFLLTIFFWMVGTLQCSDEPHRFGLIIGDSHAAIPTGWASQLQKLRPQDSLYNFAISGNTIGFDNLGKKELNELRNIHYRLAQADNSMRRIDYIIILLGTNDCKAVFDSLQSLVPTNLERLLSIVTNYDFASNSKPDVLVVTPPPIAADSMMEDKYSGARERLHNLLPHYQQLASRFNCRFVDIHEELENDFLALTEDGIHLTEPGYKRIAERINAAIQGL
ncbi:MAG TPA: GDSL-type esterase/lipase family protein [Cyclobacteriaceae bacterium]|jgi:lysophospholipase L1-like esterase